MAQRPKRSASKEGQLKRQSTQKFNVEIDEFTDPCHNIEGNQLPMLLLGKSNVLMTTVPSKDAKSISIPYKNVSIDPDCMNYWKHDLEYFGDIDNIAFGITL